MGGSVSIFSKFRDYLITFGIALFFMMMIIGIFVIAILEDVFYCRCITPLLDLNLVFLVVIVIYLLFYDLVGPIMYISTILYNHPKYVKVRNLDNLLESDETFTQAEVKEKLDITSTKVLSNVLKTARKEEIQFKIDPDTGDILSSNMTYSAVDLSTFLTRCRKCGEETIERFDDIYVCSNCGYFNKTCRFCNYQFKQGDSYCTHCGSDEWKEKEEQEFDADISELSSIEVLTAEEYGSKKSEDIFRWKCGNIGIEYDPDNPKSHLELSALLCDFPSESTNTEKFHCPSCGQAENIILRSEKTINQERYNSRKRGLIGFCVFGFVVNWILSLLGIIKSNQNELYQVIVFLFFLGIVVILLFIINPITPNKIEIDGSSGHIINEINNEER